MAFQAVKGTILCRKKLPKMADKRITTQERLDLEPCVAISQLSEKMVKWAPSKT
jgi:hypothetical protein